MNWQDTFNDLVVWHNELLDEQKEYQKKLIRRDLGDEERKETFDQWLDSLDELWNLSNNVIRLSSNAQDSLKYCEVAKSEILKTNKQITE